MPRVDLLPDADLTSAEGMGRVERGRRRRRRTRLALLGCVLGAVVVLSGAVAVASMVTYGDSSVAKSKSAAASPSVFSSPSVSPSPSVSSAPSASPSPSASPVASPSPVRTRPSAPIRPTAAVIVYNNTTIRGLAATSAQRVRDVGFTVRAIGNLYGDVDRTTVFYRAGGRAQADLLAERLRGLQAVRPAPSWLPGTASVILVVKADFAA